MLLLEGGAADHAGALDNPGRPVNPAGASPGQPTTLESAPETVIMMLEVLLPKAVTEVMIARNTRAQIRPYSMAVAPRSSRQNLFR